MYLQANRLELDHAVDVREDGGRIVIEPVLADEYDLKRLLAGITRENMHAEVDFGAPVGRELLQWRGATCLRPVISSVAR